MRRTSWKGIVDAAPVSGRILVVDDDPEIRRVVARLLARNGHRFQTAASAEEADHWLGEHRFDICLLDIELPRMSGLEFLRWSLMKDPEMAVIMLTGVDAPDVALECLDHGARTFLVKPVEAPFLLRSVRDALALRRLLVEHNDAASTGMPEQRTPWHAS